MYGEPLCSTCIVRYYLDETSAETEFMNVFNFVDVSGHNLESSQFYMDISNHIGNGVWFSIRFSSFIFYSVQYLNCRNCKRLREFEEIEISRHSCRGNCE